MSEIENKTTVQAIPQKDSLKTNEPVNQVPPDVSLIIFGASGDLTRRKLIPALGRLEKGGFLPHKKLIVGISRTPMSHEAFRQSMKKEAAAQEENPEGEDSLPLEILSALYYCPMDLNNLESYRQFKVQLEEWEREKGIAGNRLFYLAVAPELFTPILHSLQEAGLIYSRCQSCWSRVIIEKPFGHDLSSARALNAEVTSILDESQVYRIDHYLGKETVQNILGFRFGNSIFEPLFNQKYIDNVQLTVAETLGMEGRRGAYFDGAGMLRDMVQNHMLQLLCLIAMEPPAANDAQSIRDEKVKVLRALVPMEKLEVAKNTVRGQYGPGKDAQSIPGYRQEVGVSPQSSTESYVAMRLLIDNWRWAGVPFYLRAGKRLRSKVTEIAIHFRQPPMHLFRPSRPTDSQQLSEPLSNLLILRIQPDEGICLSFACKRPGMQFRLQEVQMDFVYRQSFQERAPEAYERLLLDALRGDASLFTRSDEVEYAWRFITSIHQGWSSLPDPQFPNYAPFSEGPEEAARLMEGTKHRWHPLPGIAVSEGIAAGQSPDWH